MFFILIKGGDLATEVLIEGRKGKETQGVDGHLQAREKPGAFSLMAPGRSQPCGLLEFILLASRTVGQESSVSEAPDLWYFVMTSLTN